MRWVMVALRQMYDLSRPQGESCYRLMNRSGQFIYLKTRGFLEIDEKTNRVHSFVCINTLVNEEEGKRLIREMKRHFAVIIQQNELSAVTNNSSDVPAIEEPQQLESAIMTLITNLRSSSSSSSSANLDYNIPSVESDYSVESESSSRSQQCATPLSYVPPQFNTIKSTVFKSADVLASATNKKVKTAKTNNNHQKSEVLTQITTRNITPERPSVLKMHGNYTPTTFSVYQETHIKYEPPSPIDPNLPLRTDTIESESYQKPPKIISESHLMVAEGTSSSSMSSQDRPNLKRSYTNNETNIMTKRRMVSMGAGDPSVSPCIRMLEDPCTGKCQFLKKS